MHSSLAFQRQRCVAAFRCSRLLRRHNRVTDALRGWARRSSLSLCSAAPVSQQRHGSSSRSNAGCSTSVASAALHAGEPISPLAPSSSSAVPPSSNCVDSKGWWPVDYLCPTSATLVVTDGSAHVSMPHCATTVHSAVQQRLYSLLVEQWLAPLLHPTKSDGGEADDVPNFAEAEKVAAATLSVQAALRRTRHVAFFTSSPRLQHPSWAPLCAAYLTHMQRPKERNTVAAADDEMIGQRGDEEPLFGTAARGTFFPLPVPSAGDGGDLAVASEGVPLVIPSTSPPHSSEAAEHFPLPPKQHEPPQATDDSAPCVEAANGAGCPSPGPSSTPDVLQWECFRVDSYMPSYVQLQAAVRHLLRERRPPLTCWSATHHHHTAARHFPPRTLAVIALVVPDHQRDLYGAFLSALERERAAEAPHSAASVQLLLFNSGGLLRVCDAV